LGGTIGLGVAPAAIATPQGLPGHPSGFVTL
jgi:hypothetical protein